MLSTAHADGIILFWWFSICNQAQNSLSYQHNSCGNVLEEFWSRTAETQVRFSGITSGLVLKNDCAYAKFDGHGAIVMENSCLFQNSKWLLFFRNKRLLYQYLLAEKKKRDTLKSMGPLFSSVNLSKIRQKRQCKLIQLPSSCVTSSAFLVRKIMILTSN